MNVELRTETLAPARFVTPHDDVSEPPTRVVEYVRPPHPVRVESEPLASRTARPWPIQPHSRLPNWLARFLALWGLLTLASLTGPCRPLSPSPAFAAKASP